MEIQKIAINLLVISCFFFSIVNCQSIPTPLVDSIKKDSSLPKSILCRKFILTNQTCKIDSLIIKHLMTITRSACIACPGENFNIGDVQYPNLCNVRLIQSGKDSEGVIQYILFEQGTMGGIENNCYIYKFENRKIASLIKIGVANSVKTVKTLKRAIMREEYIFPYK